MKKHTYLAIFKGYSVKFVATENNLDEVITFSKKWFHVKDSETDEVISLNVMNILYFRRIDE
ncbi:hypothetical protein QK912_10960 [Lactococcus lactis]|uniref:hypothetical protein n=1 Tax=Lactococcus lactis TaxID=1358 RepID=UPI0025A1FBF2|nr:hypothetical protein [Lactococcus lactis]MDM7537523.1 hypothetical protein [Lactococcus lactis]